MVVAQDHRRSRLPRCRGKELECAAAGDHAAAVAGGIQACTEDGTVPQIIRQCKLSATAAKIHSGPEVLFKTCIAIKFVDDDDEFV